MTQSNQPAARLTGPEGARQLRVFGETPEQMSAKLDRTFDQFEASVAEHQDHWLTAPAEGRWSPAQVTEHVIIVNEGISRIVKLLLSDRPLREMPRTPGHLKDGKFQAPAGLAPGEGQSWEVLKPRWQASRDVLAELTAHLNAADPSRHMFHPFFEDLDALDWMRTAIAQTAQHRRQLEE